MRTKTVRQAYLGFSLPSSLTRVVGAYRREYGAINEVLWTNPAVLDLAHADVCRWLSDSDRGWEGRYTSEEIDRVLVVMFVEQASYEDAVVCIENRDSGPASKAASPCQDALCPRGIHPQRKSNGPEYGEKCDHPARD